MEMLSNQGRKYWAKWYGEDAPQIYFFNKVIPSWWLEEASFVIWNVTTCMDTCMDWDWYELGVPISFSLRITEKWTYWLGQNPAAGKLCLWELPVLANQRGLWLFPGTVAWFASYTQILFLPKTEWPCLQFLQGTAPWLVLFSALFGEHYLRQGKAVSLSIVTSTKDDHMPVFELGPGPFWFADIDEIGGISMVVTYMVCESSYLLGQSHTHILNFNFSWNYLWSNP